MASESQLTANLISSLMRNLEWDKEFAVVFQDESQDTILEKI